MSENCQERVIGGLGREKVVMGSFKLNNVKEIQKSLC